MRSINERKDWLQSYQHRELRVFSEVATLQSAHYDRVIVANPGRSDSIVEELQERSVAPEQRVTFFTDKPNRIEL